MLVEQEACTVREAVGVFNRSEDLQDAIDELLSSGFDRAEVSLSRREMGQDRNHGRHQARDCLVRYSRDGRVLAVASIFRDLENLREEVAMERRVARPAQAGIVQ
jgi:hypothetical protein